MCIRKTISELGFCDYQDNYFQLNDMTVLPYYCCKKNNFVCSKENLNCGRCDKIVSKYIIFDLTENNVRALCNETILNDYDSFLLFQEKHLSKMFFHDSEYVRYNIYLLFVCDSSSPSIFSDEKYRKFESNLDFARKIFLTEKNFIEFFRFYERIENNNLTKKNKSENYEKLKSCVEKLNKFGMMSALIDDSDYMDRSQLLFDHMDNFDKQGNYYDKKLLGDLLSNNINVKTFMSKYFPDLDSSVDNKYLIKHISSMNTFKFRPTCFRENFSIDFGLVNIIAGINTIGKTSILEGIEYALTGQTHKSEIEKNDISKVEIFSSDNKSFSSENKEEYALRRKAWYPNRIGTLNDLFCRINYFDTDAAYRFALERDESETNITLLSLFCDAELVEILSRIEWHKNFFKMVLDNETKQMEHFKEVFIKSDSEIPKFLKKSDSNFISDLKRLFNIFENQNLIKETDKNKDSKNKNKRKPSSVLPLYEYFLKSNDRISFCNEILKTLNDLSEINEIINKQIADNIDIINIVFRKLHSYEQYVQIKNKCTNEIVAVDSKTSECITPKMMSTAQRVCLALAVIFAQFFSNKNAPKFILLDESVANFDSYHLLNLFDFLKELSTKGIQIFFTTANLDISSAALKKFGFLKEDFKRYNLTKDDDGKAKIDLLSEF